MATAETSSTLGESPMEKKSKTTPGSKLKLPSVPVLAGAFTRVNELALAELNPNISSEDKAILSERLAIFVKSTTKTLAAAKKIASLATELTNGSTCFFCGGTQKKSTKKTPLSLCPCLDAHRSLPVDYMPYSTTDDIRAIFQGVEAGTLAPETAVAGRNCSFPKNFSSNLTEEESKTEATDPTEQCGRRFLITAGSVHWMAKNFLLAHHSLDGFKPATKCDHCRSLMRRWLREKEAMKRANAKARNKKADAPIQTTEVAAPAAAPMNPAPEAATAPTPNQATVVPNRKVKVKTPDQKWIALAKGDLALAARMEHIDHSRRKAEEAKKRQAEERERLGAKPSNRPEKHKAVSEISPAATPRSEPIVNAEVGRHDAPLTQSLGLKLRAAGITQ